MRLVSPFSLALEAGLADLDDLLCTPLDPLDGFLLPPVPSGVVVSTPPSTSPMSEQETKRECQRAKERDKARRAYQRKMGRLQLLRDEAKQLETQLKRLNLQQGGDLRPAISPADEFMLAAVSRSPNVPMARPAMEKRLRMLWEWGAQLRQSNNSLRQQFAARTEVALRLEELLGREERPYITFASQLLYLRPLTAPECAEVHRQAMEVVRMFSLNAVLSAPLIRQVSGWYERREVEGGLFRYALQKRFPRSGPVEPLALKTFAMATTPEGMRRFYTEGLDVEVRLIQKVDDTNVLLYQQMRTMDPDNELAVTKGLILVSLIKINNGYRIHINGLSGDQIPLADRQSFEEATQQLPVFGSMARDAGGKDSPVVVEIWNGQFCWIQLEEIPAKQNGEDHGVPDCLCTYAGVTPTVGSNANFWMAEVVLHTLRWEHGLMGPWVSLPPGE